MRLTETLLFYLLAGGVVAVAMYLVEATRSLRQTLFLVVSSVLFWPLYLPVLLSLRKTPTPAEPSPTVNGDTMTTAIDQVERELIAALTSLEGWPETALAREQGRVEELRTALSSQAQRIRDIDRLLETTGHEDQLPPPANSSGTLDTAALARWQKSQRSREQNFRRLAAIRRQSHADLMATLAWIRELVSMIHLAKFTGAPAARTKELVAQIEAAIEGVSLLGRQEGPLQFDGEEDAAPLLPEGLPALHTPVTQPVCASTP